MSWMADSADSELQALRVLQAALAAALDCPICLSRLANPVRGTLSCQSFSAAPRLS